MKPLARRALALSVAAALFAAQWPSCAWAAVVAEPSPAEAMAFFRKHGVVKGDNDPLLSYLGGAGRLTPIGLTLYLSMLKRHNPADEAEALKPVFERLRKNGPYTEARANNVGRTLRNFEAKFGALDKTQAGSVEDSFRTGALSEALMTGAAINDPPKPGSHMQLEVPDGFEFWDREGLAFRTTKNNVTTYNRELQKNQRLMNASRPADVPQIPETGRYNYPMFEYSFSRLKSQEEDYVRALRIDRMIALAELLGRNYPGDMWFNDPTLEADLIRDAKAKNYDHNGRVVNVFEFVDSQFELRRSYLAGSRKAVERFHTDMLALKGVSVITDGQVGTMALNEANATRWLTMTVIETQIYQVRNMSKRVDPTSPDAQMIMKMIDESDLTVDQKILYKSQGVKMKARLDELTRVLDEVRRALKEADYAGSMEMLQAVLGSTQKELGELAADYAIYLEIPSTGWLAKAQTYDGWNPFYHITRGLWKKTPWAGKYAESMKVLEGDGKNPSLVQEYKAIAVLLASGKKEDWIEARRRIIALNPRAADYALSVPLNGEVPKVNDALRISSSLKVAHDHIAVVTETNKSLDAAGTYLTWVSAIALMATPVRMTLNGVGKMSGTGIKLIQAGVETGGAKGLALRAVGRTMLVTGEIAKHTAARLSTLEPGAAWVQKTGGDTMIGQYLAASGARALSVAGRQAAFTAMSAGISGGFTAFNHLWDMASLSVGDQEILRRGHSMFSEDLAGAGNAFMMGAKGGAWWANESWHPALGYIGLPTTAYSGTRVSGLMDTIGTRGLFGSSTQGLKTLTHSRSALEAAEASGASEGLLAKLSEKSWKTGGPAAAFGMSMVDNVAKYALFSQAAGWLGEKYAWNVHTRVPITLPLLGTVTSPQEDVERRIKVSNQVGRAWLEAPLWILLPTYAAHAIADAAPMMRSRQGALQYDKEGRTAEYLSKANGELVNFLKPEKPPLSQRIFEARFFADPPAMKWAMTEQIRRTGIRKELVRMLAGPEGKIESINPLEFYKMTKLADNKRFVNVHMNDEVRLVAHQDFVDALLSRPKQTQLALQSKPGELVAGFGRVTPEIQLDIAVALYSAETMAGKKVPAALSQTVLSRLGPYVEANGVTKPYAKAFIEAVGRAPAAAPKLDAAFAEMKQAVGQWLSGKGEFAKKPYSSLVTSLRAQADAKLQAGELAPVEHRVMSSMYDYVLAIEKRFNSFNKVETVSGLNSVTLEALRTEFSGRSEMTRLLDGFSRELGDYSRARPGKPVDGPQSDGAYSTLLAKFGNDLNAAQGRLTPNEASALSKAITDMKAAPWVLHDLKGSALPSWRPKQFMSFMESLAEIGQGGREGASIRLFQKLTTGGGKTMLVFEGLLPLAEVDAAAHNNMEVTFLTVQSNLEAQARMEFIAYKKIGSKLTFDTYEGFKSKIAEGKMKGSNALKRYWILGDEMDGAALQPALTIGQVSGYVTRKNGVGARLDEIDTSLGKQLERGRLERASNTRTEARRLSSLFEGISDVRAQSPETSALRAESQRLEAAAEQLAGKNGRRASTLVEARVRESMTRLQSMIESLPARDGEVAATAKQSLARLEKALNSNPGSTREFQRAALAELKTGFKEQGQLMGLLDTKEGFGRVTREARKTRVALEARIERLEGERAAAESSKAKGAPLRASALNQEIELARQEKAFVERFERSDPSARLMSLDKKITAFQQDGVAGEKLGRLLREASRLDASLPAERRAAHDAYRSKLARVYELGREMAVIDEQVVAAGSANPGAKTAAQNRLAALESERATVRAALKSMEVELGARPSTGHRGVLKSEVKLDFARAADDIVGIVQKAQPGWENAALRLLERRRGLLEAYAGDENPMYQVYREMKDSAWSIARNDALLSQDPIRYNQAGARLLKKIDGEGLTTLAPKLLWKTLKGEPMKVEEVGLTRQYAWKMLKALFQDPMTPVTQRDSQFWSFVNSLLFPKGIAHGERGSSWVRSEIVSLVQGYHDNPAGVRLDGRTGKFNVVHNGQWFESMDNATRRWWELEYGTDLTLPYTHQSISTIKDVTTFKGSRFISLSGTSGKEFERHMKEQGVRISGKGSDMPENVSMDVVSGPGMKFTRMREALESVSRSSRERVVLRPTDLSQAPRDVKAAVDSYLAANSLPSREPSVVEIGKVQSSAARTWLNGLRATQKDSGLLVLSVSDTRVLRVVLDYLKRSGVKPNEIAKVFSDTEYLRLNVPEAKVLDQMNLNALNNGEVKVLILDTRVGGRGLDLNFKGDRDNPTPT
ncbi:MAG: hypothetical protein AAB036_05345, partial [Elusimicrobiota bacterium]